MNDPGDEHADAPAAEPRLVTLLRFHANHLSMRYHGAPVYLVGGALRDREPRDVDIVVIVPDELFWRTYVAPDHHVDWLRQYWRFEHFGAKPSRAWKRWARDCTKQAAWLTKAIGDPIVDFKVQHETEAASIDKPRLQLSVDFLAK